MSNVPYYKVQNNFGQGIDFENKFYKLPMAVKVAAAFAGKLSTDVRINRFVDDQDTGVFATVLPNGEVVDMRDKLSLIDEIATNMVEVQASTESNGLKDELTTSIAELATAKAHHSSRALRLARHGVKKAKKKAWSPKGVSIRLIIRLIMKLPVQARKAVNKQLRTLIKKKASTAEFKKFAAALNKLVSKHGGKPHKVTRRKVAHHTSHTHHIAHRK